jgi:transcriptional regulator with XRE-family HTH domain
MKDRIKQVRSSLGKSQRDMAALIKVAYKSWQGYESGDNVPGGNVLQSLAKLGFNINWILTGEGPMRVTDLGGADVIRGDEEDYHSVAERRTEYNHAPVLPEIQPVIDAFMEVMTSGVAETILALTQNTYEFRDKVRMHKREAEKDVKIASLERDMEAIKRMLQDAFSKSTETDFKTMEMKREKISGGGNGD